MEIITQQIKDSLSSIAKIITIVYPKPIILMYEINTFGKPFHLAFLSTDNFLIFRKS